MELTNFWTYIQLGYLHILPEGWDHILFVICLFFGARSLKFLLMELLVFTVAHSVTLGLTWFGAIHVPGSWVEPAIALSIAVLAIENFWICDSDTSQYGWKLLLIAGFGLVHGMGFASALSESSAAFLRQNLLLSLFGFNLGVELGQLTVVLFLYWCIWRLCAKAVWYNRWIVKPTSAVIAMVALIAFVLRIR